MEELLVPYYQITVAYCSVLITLGVILLVAHVPRQEKLRNYISGRRYFAASFLFLGLLGVMEVLSWHTQLYRQGEAYSFEDALMIISASYISAWLNAYAYLLILNPAHDIRQKVFRYGCVGLMVVMFIGAAGWLLPASLAHYVIWALGIVYAVEVLLLFRICQRVYLNNVAAMDDYYDNPAELSWMNGVIMFTLILAFVNLLQLFIPEVCIPLRIMVILFSVYFAIRIIDHVPVFLSIVTITQTDAERARPNILPAELPSRPSYFYPDNMPLIVSEWVMNKSFCQKNLDAAETARQMNTNRSYLSAYLNHGLNKTYSQWIKELRVDYAKNLFKENPEKKISEIGAMVGIPEVYNFSRHFKQATGLSPQKWIEKSLTP